MNDLELRLEVVKSRPCQPVASRSPLNISETFRDIG